MAIAVNIINIKAMAVEINYYFNNKNRYYREAALNYYCWPIKINNCYFEDIVIN